jgi:hypothetical protein
MFDVIYYNGGVWGTLNQMRCLCTVLFAILLAAPGICAKKEVRDWKTGRVLDSHLAKSSVATGSTTNTNGTATVNASDTSATVSGQSTSSTRIDFADIRDNQLVILGDEFAYVVEDTRVSGGHGLLSITAHAISNRKHGCRFIVGDNVEYSQTKGTLYILDADQKECKLDILRQERLKK